jgi:hypothetical protein
MVQVSIAYVALAVGVLLVLAGLLALADRTSGRMLAPHQRRLLLGGVYGMLTFLVAILFWLRGAVWLR